MVKIFLCHANEDKPQVREVYQRLKAEGFEPWLDEEDLLPGQLWDQEIRRALRESDFILIFFSRNSVAKRGYVQREMKLALNAWEEVPEGQIHTIPVRLDDCEIPERFQRFQRADFFVENGYERLFRGLRAGIGEHEKPERNPLYNYIDIGSHMLPNLTPIDTSVLKLCCEKAIEIGHTLIGTGDIISKSGEINISDSDIHESIDILGRKGYLHVSYSSSVISHFSITLLGFDKYARSFISNYRNVVEQVVSTMINKDITQNELLCSELNIPIRIIDHILRVLESKNLIDISKSYAGYEIINIHNISPELERMFK